MQALFHTHCEIDLSVRSARTNALSCLPVPCTRNYENGFVLVVVLVLVLVLVFVLLLAVSAISPLVLIQAAITKFCTRIHEKVLAVTTEDPSLVYTVLMTLYSHWAYKTSLL